MENQSLFRELIESLINQTNGNDGLFVLSENGKIISFSSNTELIKDFAPFCINSKSVLSKLQAYLEKNAMTEAHFDKSYRLIAEIESFVSDIASDVPFDVYESKVSIGGVIKSLGVEIVEDYTNPLEKIFDYMEAIRFLSGDKLFVFVGMRSYFDDEHMLDFFRTIVSHDYKAFFIEPIQRKSLYDEMYCIIDSDLCEI